MQENNLINGRTAEEIKERAKYCAGRMNCEACPYELTEVPNCYEFVIGDAVALIEKLEKEREEALIRPIRKPLDFEAFADRARNDPHFIPILEIREVYFNQTDVTLTPVRFDLQDIRRNDAYACYLFGQADPRFLKIKEYGITWRCWEDVPSVEEQKAAFVGGEIR